MGIRIHKDIGYFLNKKDVKAILVPDYDEIIDDLSVDEDFIQKMQHEFQQLTNNNNQVGYNYASIQLQQFFNQPNISFNDFVKSIYHHDSFKGVMFQTPDLAKESHFDDLIDYYENVSNPKYKIQLLQQAIYPENYYICVKVPSLGKNSLEIYAQESPKKPNLEVGDLVSSDKLHYLMLYEGLSSQNDRVKAWAYPEENSQKYFHPYINVITYIVAKVSGILKPHISYVEFSQYLEPAIVTHWG